VVASAAGIKLVLERFTEPSSAIAAGLLGTGIALYLAGEGAFRVVLKLQLRRGRIIGAALILAAIPLGLLLSGFVQLSATLAILVTVLVLEKPWKAA